MPIWRCKVKNGVAGWTQVEVVGTDFLTEFRRRFGGLEYKDVEQFDYVNNRWVKVDV